MRAIRGAAGATLRGPRGGLYKMVNGKRVAVKKGAKPAVESSALQHQDAHLARQRAELGALIRSNPMAAMRALAKMHPEGHAAGASHVSAMLSRGLSKVLG